MHELDVMRRLAELEHRVAHLYEHLGASIPPLPERTNEVPAEFVQMARDGDLIGAIKRYRDSTGLGLAEAKEKVEQAARGL